MASSSQTETLKCHICPKKPNFSDTSHLLTHVSSKGHLSHYFKLQVRSHQEPEAVELLATYDRWYHENNLAELLSDRLKAKDSRKTKNSKGGSGSGGSGGGGGGSRGPVATTVGNGGVFAGAGAAKKDNNSTTKLASTAGGLLYYGPEAASSAAGTSSSALAIANKKAPVPAHVLDPRLTQPYPFPDQRQDSLASSQLFGRSDNTTFSHSSFASVPTWPPLAQNPSDLPTRSSAPSGWKREPSSETDEEIISPLARKTRALMEVTNLNLPSSRRVANPLTGPDPFVDEPSVDYERNKENVPKTSEATKLKGVLLPGMDIFDAATEQMRRKRNQKKDRSVLKQMEKLSEMVEPTEHIFSPGGALRKQRYIYSLPEDNTPLKGETPIFKRRISRRKRVSSPMLSHGGPKTSSGLQLNAQLERLSQQALPLLDSPMVPHGSLNFGSQLPTGPSEFKWAFPHQPQRYGHGFSVYNDEEQQPAAARVSRTLTDVTNIRRDQNGHYAPSSMDMGSRLPAYDTKPTIDQNSKYPRPRAAEISTGKENIHPALGQVGGMNLRTGNASWEGQQFGAKNPHVASQYPYGAGFPVGGYHGFTENEPAEYTQNPLSYSFAPPVPPHMAGAKDVRSCRTHDRFTSPDCKSVKSNRAVSPDGTVSDIDQDDLEQMYLDSVAR